MTDLTDPSISGDGTEGSEERRLTRRRALVLAGGVTGGLLAATSSVGAGVSAAATAEGTRAIGQRGRLPAMEMQKILRAEGTVTSGVLNVGLDRSDIGTVKGPHGIPFKPSFQINANLFFQPLGAHRAFFNGDIPVRAEEMNRVIDAIVANGLVFQAQHQHFFDLSPMIYFIHFRGVGQPLALAEAVHKVVAVTGIPLPQTMPKHPTSPLDHERLGKILQGDATVGSDGIVTVDVLRRDAITIAGIHVSPSVNIATGIAFQPLNHNGSRTAAAPDFAMTAGEITPVMTVMRAAGFEVHCLYNQETSESPQLYFSHQLAVGDPYTLATDIRRGLDHTRSH